VQHGKTYANLEAGDDVLHIGLNRAVTLIADKLAKGPRGRRFGDPGRPLGEHPDKGGPVVVKAGRYGPYVSHDGINATLPRDKTPEAITLGEALALLAARAERVGESRPTRRKAAKPAAELREKSAPADRAAKSAAPAAAAKPAPPGKARQAAPAKKPARTDKSAAARKAAKSRKPPAAAKPAEAAKRAKGAR
jgi:DNA topoisomerase-1